MLKNIWKKINNRLHRPYHRRLLRDHYLLPKSEISYANDLLYTRHNADFITEPKFAGIYRDVKAIGGNLLRDYDIQWRIHVLCWFANTVRHLEGDFVDCGVHTGFYTKAVIDYVDFDTLGKTYYLFDTFSGMDPRYSNDYEMKRHEILGYGTDNSLYDQIRERFLNHQVDIVRGAIPDTLNEREIKRVAYLSIDMNSVYPEVAALNFFWDKLVEGGVIILDDYGYPGCGEQKAAHDQFAASKGVEVLSLPTSQGVIIKPFLPKK